MIIVEIKRMDLYIVTVQASSSVMLVQYILCTRSANGLTRLCK